MGERADLRPAYPRLSVGTQAALRWSPGVMCMNGILKRFVHLVLISFCLSTVLLAQSGEVSLRGQVTDQSGAVVPHIPVTLIGPGGVTREAANHDSDGRYVFPDLPAGTYPLRVSVPGFAPIEKTGVGLTPCQPQGT